MTRNPPTTRLPNSELRLGLAVAGLLGSGGSDSQRSTVDGQLSGLLCHLGAGALAWWRIRDTDLADTPAAVELHNVYRQQRLAVLRHERDIVTVVSLLRREGIEPVLVKGWAIARHYPEPGLRPYGDIDLCVSPTQFAQASQVLKRSESLAGPFVDLHCGFSGIGVGKRLLFSAPRHAQREWEELYSRTSLSQVQRPKSNVYLPGEDVEHCTLDIGQQPANSEDLFSARVLSDEDHLRILCLHLLRSGVRRPSWLCDVAVMLRRQTADGRRPEKQSPTLDSQKDIGHWTLDSGFDWQTCLGRNPLHANWVATAVLLAHELLGADISHTPFAGRKLPQWIVTETLQQWGGKAHSKSNIQGPKSSRVQSPKSSLGTQTLDTGHSTFDWYRRWDNPIRATAAVNGKFTRRPQLRYRVAELIARLPEVPDHLRALRVDSGQSRVGRPQLPKITDPVSFY